MRGLSMLRGWTMMAAVTAHVLVVMESSAASDISNALCALPVTQLALPNATACVNVNGALLSACRSACACRQRDQTKSDQQNLYALCVADESLVCLNNAVNCSSTVLNVAKNTAEISIPIPTLVIRTTDGEGDDTNDKLSNGAIAGIIVAGVIVLGILIFIFNWFRNRPTKGDNRESIQLATMTTKARPSSAQLSSRSHDPTHPTISSDDVNYHGFDSGEDPRYSRENLNNMGLDASQGPLHISHLVSSQDIRVQQPHRFSPRSDSDESSSSIDIDGDSFYHSRQVPDAPRPRKKSIEF